MNIQTSTWHSRERRRRLSPASDILPLVRRTPRFSVSAQRRPLQPVVLPRHLASDAARRSTSSSISTAIRCLISSRYGLAVSIRLLNFARRNPSGALEKVRCRPLQLSVRRRLPWAVRLFDDPASSPKECPRPFSPGIRGLPFCEALPQPVVCVSAAPGALNWRSSKVPEEHRLHARLRTHCRCSTAAWQIPMLCPEGEAR